MTVEVFWMRRPRSGVRHAVKGVHVLGARVSVCGQASDNWKLDNQCDRCKICSKKLAQETKGDGLRPQLHAAIMAREERAEIARKALKKAVFKGGVFVSYTHQCGALATAEAVEAFHAAEAPDAVLGHVARDLNVLERHWQETLGGAALRAGDECRCGGPWSCPEVVDLAEAYNLNVDGSDK